MCVSQMAINIWTELHIQLTWKLFESQSINLIIGAGIAVHSSFSLQGGTKASPSRMEIEWIIQLSILWTKIPSNARKLSPHSNRYQQWSTIQKKLQRQKLFSLFSPSPAHLRWSFSARDSFLFYPLKLRPAQLSSQTTNSTCSRDWVAHRKRTLKLYIILTFRRVIRCYRRACRSCLHSTLLNALSSMKEFVMELHTTLCAHKNHWPVSQQQAQRVGQSHQYAAITSAVSINFHLEFKFNASRIRKTR